MYEGIKDTGIVLKRVNLRGNACLYVVLSSNHGKLPLFSYGTRKITSKRISHLQTGNYISFSASRRKGLLYLGETELLDAFVGVRTHTYKMDHMFTSFFIIDKILQDEQRESSIFYKTLSCLKNLGEAIGKVDIDKVFDEYIRGVLQETGFVSVAQVALPTFEPIQFVERLTERRIKRII